MFPQVLSPRTSQVTSQVTAAICCSVRAVLGLSRSLLSHQCQSTFDEGINKMPTHVPGSVKDEEEPTIPNNKETHREINHSVIIMDFPVSLCSSMV